MGREWMSMALAVAACGPAVGDADDAPTSTSSGGGSTGLGEEVSGVAATYGSADVTSTGEPTTHTSDEPPSTESSASSSSSGCADESGAPPVLCGPEPDDGFYVVRFDEDRVGSETVDVDTACTVDAITSEDDATSYVLACDGTEHVVEVRSDPPVDLGVVALDTVHLRAIRDYPSNGGGHLFIVVRDESGEIVLASYQPKFDEVPPIDLPEFFAPIAFAAVDMGCEPVRQGLPSCGLFVVDGCPADVERLAVDFTLGDATVRTWSEMFGVVGSLRVFAEASFYEPLNGHDCFDLHPPFIQARWTALRPVE